jgi:hypothetical protein
MFIWCEFFLDDFGSGRYLRLTSDTEPDFLIKNPKQIRDAQIEKSSIEMKSKYELKLTNSFRDMKQGSEVDVYGLTFFCPNNSEATSGSMSTLYFNRIECENDVINAIVLNRHSDLNAGSPSDDAEQQEEFRFTPKVYTPYGRYGNVKLWSVENVAVIPEEDPHTYIICTSEIFY